MYYSLIALFLVIVAVGYLIDYRRNKKQFTDMGRAALWVLIIGAAIVTFLLIVRKPVKVKGPQNPRLYEMKKSESGKDSLNKASVQP